MFYIFEKALELAESIYIDITDPERATKIENAFKEALLQVPEDVDSIEDRPVLIGLEKVDKDHALNELEGVDFVKTLYKSMGIHLVLQGLQSNKELIPVAKEYSDLARMFRDLMGWDKRSGIPDPNRKTSYLDWKREWRAKDYLVPSVIVGFDEEFFIGCPPAEQIKRLEKLQSLLGKDYLSNLGVVKGMMLAARTATLDGKEEKNAREYAEGLCNRKVRIVMQNDQYYTIGYNASDGFDKRQVVFHLDDIEKGNSDVGLALGRVVEINTRSDQPLGMKED
jgi:hypothetical protein